MGLQIQTRQHLLETFEVDQMKDIEIVTEQLEIWCQRIVRKQPDIEKLSDVMFEELDTIESCLELIEDVFNLERKDKYTR